jgi:hypothetical protein
VCLGIWAGWELVCLFLEPAPPNANEISLCLRFLLAAFVLLDVCGRMWMMGIRNYWQDAGNLLDVLALVALLTSLVLHLAGRHLVIASVVGGALVLIRSLLRLRK